ncbi:hypothetical protein AOXY_G29712 [Acipenser oxyrinchus oxyrinchus]|uniref:Cornifelin n=1 Tax=Acipenser oxyrinchus oxyrinchus TaxID=40147 RepID=A0AAD8FTT1_ACIOX|nr:hypothetical protein AOXY_G29712 [Acipenser oxyrinchus oxyrinchus]
MAHTMVMGQPVVMGQPMAMAQPMVTAQPMGMPQQQVIVQQSHAVTQLQVNPRKWDSGILSCAEDMQSCCFGMLCLPLLQIQVAQNMGEGCLVTLLCGTSVAMRTGFRERHKIEGSIADDCLKMCLFYPCAWCQMAREVEKRKTIVSRQVGPTVFVGR